MAPGFCGHANSRGNREGTGLGPAAWKAEESEEVARCRTNDYSVGKFGFTATSNYTGKVLKAANRVTVRYSNEPANRYHFEYLYQAPRELVDLRIDYKHSRRFTPYFQARNVFGRAIVTSTPYRPQNRAEYGDPICELGVRGVW